jgi:WD40 repeat protein
VVSVLFTPDGRRLVSCDRESRVILWDSATVRQQLSFRVREKCDETMAISPDGTTLALGGDGVGLWDLANGRQIRIFDESSSPVRCISFELDGRSIVTTRERELRCWDVPSGQLKWMLEGQGSLLYSVTHNPNQQGMAWADERGMVGFWANWNGYAGKIPTGQGRVWCATFAPDGRTLATASRDGTVKLWDVARDKDRYLIPVGSPNANSIAFSPDGRTLSAAGGDGTVRSWETPEGKAISTRQFPFSGKLVCATLSQDATTVALLDSDRSCQVWDARTGRRILSIESAALRDKVQLSHDGKWLSGDGMNELKHDPVRVWNVANRRDFLVGDSESIVALAFCPDRDSLALGCLSSGLPLVWNLAAGRQRRGTGPGHVGGIRALEFSADGMILATGGSDRAIKIWDVDTVEERLTWQRLNGEASALSFSPDGTILALYAGGSSLTLGDLRSGELGLTLGLHYPVTDMRFSPDGSALAISGPAQDARHSLIYLWPAPRTE